MLMLSKRYFVVLLKIGTTSKNRASQLSIKR
jgi:hypothetical protein